MIYSIYHPDGFYMCDIEIRDNDSSFNKAQVNDPESENYNEKLPKWIKRPTQLAVDCAYCHCSTVVIRDGVHCVNCGRVYKSHSH